MNSLVFSAPAPAAAPAEPAFASPEFWSRVAELDAESRKYPRTFTHPAEYPVASEAGFVEYCTRAREAYDYLYASLLETIASEGCAPLQALEELVRLWRTLVDCSGLADALGLVGRVPLVKLTSIKGLPPSPLLTELWRANSSSMDTPFVLADLAPARLVGL